MVFIPPRFYTCSDRQSGFTLDPLIIVPRVRFFKAPFGEAGGSGLLRRFLEADVQGGPVYYGAFSEGGGGRFITAVPRDGS